jgi:outer membrane lipoprotein-sorting protein
MNFKKIVVLGTALLIFFPALYADGLPAPAGEKDGKAIFQKVIAALGGQEEIAKIKNYYSEVELTNYLYNPTRQNTFGTQNYIQYPDKNRYVATTPKYTVLITADGNQGWLQSPLDNYVFKPMREEDIRAQLVPVRKDPFSIARYIGQYDIKLLGEKEFAGKKAIALSFTGPEEFTLYIDPHTYLPTGSTYRAAIIGSAEPVMLETEEIYSHYREVSGVKIPFKIITNEDGRIVVLAIIKKMKFNLEFEKGLFKKPLPKEKLGGKK